MPLQGVQRRAAHVPEQRHPSALGLVAVVTGAAAVSAWLGTKGMKLITAC